jgi:hypothetical protein
MRGKLKAWLAYAACGTVAVVLITIVAVLLAKGPADRAIMVGAAIALMLQLAAFALLVAVRDKQHLFMGGWLGGMVLRFGGLGLVLFWASRASLLPRTPLAISLVGFVFVLLLLELVFLRWDLRKP